MGKEENVRIEKEYFLKMDFSALALEFVTWKKLEFWNESYFFAMLLIFFFFKRINEEIENDD